MSDRDRPVQCDVLSAVDDPHATRPQAPYRFELGGDQNRDRRFPHRRIARLTGRHARLENAVASIALLGGLVIGIGIDRRVGCRRRCPRAQLLLQGGGGGCGHGLQEKAILGRVSCLAAFVAEYEQARSGRPSRRAAAAATARAPDRASPARSREPPQRRGIGGIDVQGRADPATSVASVDADGNGGIRPRDLHIGPRRDTAA